MCAGDRKLKGGGGRLKLKCEAWSPIVVDLCSTKVGLHRYVHRYFIPATTRQITSSKGEQCYNPGSGSNSGCGGLKSVGY